MLHDVVKAGKARYIGASSMHAWQFSKAQYTATLNGWTRFVAMQNHMNLVYRVTDKKNDAFNPINNNGNIVLEINPEFGNKATHFR